jgi:hypothetical protein
MLRALPILLGCLMAPLCVVGLCWQQSFIWVVCPQALVVMFLRQAQRPYDSLGAVDYPDLAVGVLYYPIVGWILSQALKKGALARTAIRVAIWHVIALMAAVATAAFRNRLWAM